MAYEVIERFTDKKLGRVIEKGFYPHTDPRVNDEWLERLSTKNNACGRPFIRKVDAKGVSAPKAARDPKAPPMNVPDENIEALKAEADAMGVEYHPNIGHDKLLARVQEAKESAAKAAAE